MVKQTLSLTKFRALGFGADHGCGRQPTADRHKPVGRLPLLSFRHAVTQFTLPSGETHLFCWYQIILLGDRGTWLCEQLTQSRYPIVEWLGIEPVNLGKNHPVSSKNTTAYRKKSPSVCVRLLVT